MTLTASANTKPATKIGFITTWITKKSETPDLLQKMIIKASLSGCTTESENRFTLS